MIKNLLAILSVLALGSVVSAQTPPAGNANAFGNYVPNPGSFSSINPFGGMNYYSPGSPLIYNFPNQFGGLNYSTGGFSVPNPFGGMNYFGPGGNLTITVANPFGGYTVINASAPVALPAGSVNAMNDATTTPLANYNLTNGGFSTPSLFGGPIASPLDSRVPATTSNPLANYNLNPRVNNITNRATGINSFVLNPYGSFSSFAR